MSNPPSNAMVIVVDTAPGGEAVCVRITGDVDLLGEADLASTALQLPGTHCRSVYVDLAGITFAGTSLVNFLITVSARLPVGVSMSLCGPTPIVRRIIELTSLDQVAAVQDGLPANWAAPPAPLPIRLPLIATAP
jgi:anti-anti-sigma factor